MKLYFKIVVIFACSSFLLWASEKSVLSPNSSSVILAEEQSLTQASPHVSIKLLSSDSKLGEEDILSLESEVVDKKITTKREFYELVHEMCQEVKEYFITPANDTLGDFPLSKLIKWAEKLRENLKSIDRSKLKLGNADVFLRQNGTSESIERIIDRWPGQSFEESILGHLFYPVMVSRFGDISSDDYQRLFFDIRLALSARFGVMPAWKHLEKIGQTYSEECEQSSELETLARRKFSLYQQRVSEPDTSLYHQALFWRLVNEDEKARCSYIEDIQGDNPDPRSFLEGGAIMDDKGYLEKASELGQSDALVYISRLEGDDVDVFQYLVPYFQESQRANEEQQAISPFCVKALEMLESLLIKKNSSIDRLAQEKDITLEKVVKLSRGQKGWEDTVVLQNARKKRPIETDLEKSFEIYEQLGRQEHPNYFITGSKLAKKQKNSVKSVELAELAGPVLGYPLLRELYVEEPRRTEIVRRREQALKRQATYLMELSGLKEANS